MSILAGLHHVTHYNYDRPVGLGPQIVRLRPAPHCRTRIPSYSLKVTPTAAFRELAAGPARQLAGALRLPGKDHRVLGRGRSGRRSWRSSIRSISSSSPTRENFPFAYPDELREDLAPYLEPEPAGPHARGFAQDDLARAAQHRRFPRRAQSAAAARRSATSSAWSPACRTPEETLSSAAGSCRDSAWLLVQILRHIGLRRALRLRLSDPAQARREAARRPVRRRRRTSPICTPGPKSIFPAPAGSGSIRPPACSAAKATFRSRRRRITARRRRSPAWSSRRSDSSTST